MNIFAWIIFALVNGIILLSLDHDPAKGKQLDSLILGMTGALSGSLFAFFLVNGISKVFVVTFFFVVAMEMLFVMVLFFGKSLRRLRM